MFPDLPKFPYHRDPIASYSVIESSAVCECCGKARGVLYSGNTYALVELENLCPWCIADESNTTEYKYGNLLD